MWGRGNMKQFLSRLRHIRPLAWIEKQLRRLSHRQRLVLSGILGFLLIVVLIQLVYPRNRMLPNSQVLGNNVSFKSKAYVTSQITDKEDDQITVVVAGKTINNNLADMGIRIDGDATVAPALEYGWWARLVPFSILWPHQVDDFGLASSDSAKTAKFMESLKSYDQPAKQATLRLDGTTVEVLDAEDGHSYSNQAAQAELLKERVTTDLRLTVNGVADPAAVTSAEAKQAAAKVEDRLRTKLTVSVDNQASLVDPATLATWFTFTPDTAKKELTIGYSRKKISEFLKPYADKVYVAQIPKKITTIDGVLQGQVPGKAGRALNNEKSIDAIIKAASENKDIAQAVVAPVDPTTINSATYTKSSKGIQALINTWAKENSGSYYVAMHQVGGSISASLNGGTKLTPASLYKLYVVDVVYTKMAKGQISPNTKTTTGKTVSQCIELAIVRSDNPCAVALGDMIGWQKNDGFLAGQGFGSTTLSRNVLATTASDTMNLLVKLQSGSLIKSKYTTELLGYMRRQIYRNGIPAGSDGAVADKVGFLDNLNHDAGIVYHPNGKYVLVIMTKNSNFSQIADLARKISNVMSQ